MSTKEVEQMQLLAYDSERPLRDDYNHQSERSKSPGAKRTRSILKYCLLGLNASVLLISVTLNVYTWLSYPGRLGALLECVYNTDMADAWSSIAYEERVFTGALVYNSTSKRVVRKADGTQDYVGPPSKDLDDRWDELLRSKEHQRCVTQCALTVF